MNAAVFTHLPMRKSTDCFQETIYLALYPKKPCPYLTPQCATSSTDVSSDFIIKIYAHT